MAENASPAGRVIGQSKLPPILAIVLAPLLFLAPSIFGDRSYVPFDLAQYPPQSTGLSPADLEEIRSQTANMDISELPVTVIPELELAGEELRAGQLPLWNPYARFGGPLLGNGLDGLFYPPNAVLLLSDDPASMLGLLAWLAFVIAGLLMFGLLRALDLSPGASLLGALVFALSGTLTANAPFYMRLNALIWLPGMMHACLLLVRRQGRERIPPACALSVCMGMSWLAGFPPYALLSSMLLAAWAGLLCLRCATQTDAKAGLRLAGWVLAAGILGIALGAAQLLPTLEYSFASFRGQGQSGNSLASQGFDPAGFLGMLMPTLFGDPSMNSLPPYDRSPLVHLLFSRSSWTSEINASGLTIPAGTPFFPQRYNFTEYSIFIGILPLLLAILGATRRSPFRAVALTLTVLFACIATAPSWLAWLYSMPGFNTIAPQRYMAALAPLLAMLSAAGLQQLQGGEGRRPWLLPVCALITAGALFWLAAWAAGDPPLHERSDQLTQISERFAARMPGAELEEIRPIAEARFAEQLAPANDRLTSSLGRAAWTFCFAALLLGLWPLARRAAGLRAIALGLTLIFSLVELLLFAQPLNSGRVLHRGESSPVREYLREQRDLYREQGGFAVARASKEGMGIPLDLPVGQLYRERVRDLNAYAFVDPWSQAIFARLFGPAILRSAVWPMTLPDAPALGSRALDLLGLRFILSSEELEHAGSPVGPEIAGAGGKRFYIYERPQAMPRAFFVPRLRIMPDDQQVLEAMVPEPGTGSGFDPREAVLVTADQAASLPKLEQQERDQAATGREVSFLLDDPQEIRMHIEAGPPGYLVLADAALPGWQARVNEEEQHFARGNLFMRVLPVPGQAVEVHYSYQAPGLGRGLLLSTAALLCMIAGAWNCLHSRRRRHRVEINS
ncbi:MAG: glycosyltransferase family protein [Planctomycetota bacterium]|jgi:hypothetical protein